MAEKSKWTKAPKQEGPWSIPSCGETVRLPAAGGAVRVEGEHAFLWDGALFSVPVLAKWVALLTGHFLVPGPVSQHILGLTS